MPEPKRVDLCVTSMHEGVPGFCYPIEISFPPDLDEAERKRVSSALEATVKQLGYDPKWVPIV